MEVLETKIKNFLSLSNDHCHGNGSGYGYGGGFGDCSGNGDNFGNCSVNCSGNGDIFSNCSGNGDIFSNGSGNGYGDGSGDGSGNGFGNGNGSVYGNGFGYGYDDGVKDINGNHVYIVDEIRTIIKFVRGNIAQGFVLLSDLTLKPCYIVKEQSKYAHGNTLYDAFAALQEKLYDDSTEEERIEAFRKKFPEYDTPYSNHDLFTYHHVLTGSCRIGREAFCKDRGIDLDGSTTVREFVELTKGSYGGDVIRKLPIVYDIIE